MKPFRLTTNADRVGAAHGHREVFRRNDGLRAQMLADAATESRESGKPVKIG